MRYHLNLLLQKLGYHVSKKSTIDALEREVAILRTYKPSSGPNEFSWINNYLDWTESVFGTRVFPILDSSTKINTSFKSGSEYFDLCVSGIVEAEMLMCRALLREIGERNITGDLAEFGIFEGAWINNLYEFSEAVDLKRDIWGFDSFQGLSKPDTERDTSYWQEGMFSAGIDLVKQNVKADERPRIRLIEGWFSESLGRPDAQALKEVCYARIDCDIYQPSLEALNFLTTRLSHGSVLVFDDWSHNHTVGQTRAFSEWAAGVPQLQFEFLFYGVWDHFYVRVWHRDKRRW